MEHKPPTLEGQSLNHQTAKEVPVSLCVQEPPSLWHFVLAAEMDKGDIHLQIGKRVCTANQINPHLDLGLPSLQNSEKYVSVV